MLTCPRCGEQNPEHARFCLACAAPLSMPDHESRRQVTVLFCDLADSTAMGERLDPETFRRVLSRYHETAQHIVERHGGTVEKFVGDAVMAVFGVPVLHEDDALRAVRAAAVLREEMGRLNEELEREYGTRLTLRIGVNTGEVVTGTEERLAIGDAVNVAARLEQSAAPDEILLGSETLALVRAAVIADPVAPLAVKGKSKPLSASRLLAVHDESQFARHFDAPMVDRTQEIRRLVDSFGRTRGDRRCQIVTILGPAGVGKSRLAHEFLSSLDGPAVVRGRCVPYGEGIRARGVREAARAARPLGSSARSRQRSLVQMCSSSAALQAQQSTPPSPMRNAPAARACSSSWSGFSLSAGGSSGRGRISPSNGNVSQVSTGGNAMRRGDGCPICADDRLDDPGWGVRFHVGETVDAYLKRTSIQRGYTIVTWRGRHVAEPTELTDDEAAAWWGELVVVGRALEQHFEPVKLNYELLGNSVPHLHAHVLPRYADDPRPGWPFPWPDEDPPPFPEDELRRDVDALRAMLAA